MLSDENKSTLKDAAKKLTGHRKRNFMATVTQDYFNGSARQAETVLGWCRHTVQLGLNECRTGIICVDNYRARGRHKSEEKLPNLQSDIRSLIHAKALVDPRTQADPTSTSPRYPRLSARAVREALVSEWGYQESELPSRQTIGGILNRMGYCLKQHKTPNA